MKRFLTTMVTALLLTVALAVTASASDFDAAAKDLSAIGMFRGTEQGFELDRAPTRSEAAIMLVRLYGAEETAAADYKDGKITHPFTDVSDTVAPDVAWLYTNGITKGATETTFNSRGLCTDKMYCSFLLRALGYVDGTDFTYADSLTTAQSKGFYSPVMFSGTFLRDDLAALTYQALAVDLKDGSTYLLDSLVKSGAVDKDAAKSMTEKIETYRAMETAMAAMDEDAVDMDIAMKMDMTMAVNGEKATIPTDTTGNIKMMIKDDDVQMAATMKIKAEGETMDMGMWLKDGWMYLSMDDGTDSTAYTYKYQVDDAMAAIQAQLGEVTAATSMDATGLAMIDSLTAKKSGSDTVYTMVIGKGMAGYMDSVAATVGDSADVNMGDITATFTVDSKGQLKSMNMVFSAAMKMDLGEAGAIEAAYDYDMTMTVKALGSAVKITFPDFSKYQEMDPSQIPDLAA